MEKDTMKERLAEFAHKQWSSWMEYLFSKCSMNQNGTATIPAWAVERWQRQMKTLYSNLSENEKDSDRAEADRVLAIIVSKEKG